MNRNSQWEQEWELYQSFSMGDMEEAGQDEAVQPLAKPTNDLPTTISVSPLQERAALNRLRGAVNLPSAGNLSAGPNDPSFHTASNRMLSSVLGAQVEAPAIQPGEIRHLLPGLVPDVSRSVFALVAEVREGKALLMSFGPLSRPATTDELLTGLDDHGLQVLCLWNAVWVPLGTITKSWKLDVWADELLADVKKLKESSYAGDGIPDSLTDRVGARIEHPQDPRWDYLEQEGELFVRILDN